MKYFFSLRINTKPEHSITLNDILGVESNNPQISWGYNLKVKDDGYTNFIECFLNILEGKYDKLSDLDITRDDISIWLIYEYEGQCNMEFAPNDLKRLGDNGITLCISCYEASSGI
jgi:hypothetical protein